MEDATAGDPISGLKWTHQSLRQIQQALHRTAHTLSLTTSSRLLRLGTYSLRVNSKRQAGKQAAGRAGAVQLSGKTPPSISAPEMACH